MHRSLPHTLGHGWKGLKELWIPKLKPFEKQQE